MLQNSATNKFILFFLFIFLPFYQLVINDRLAQYNTQVICIFKKLYIPRPIRELCLTFTELLFCRVTNEPQI